MKMLGDDLVDVAVQLGVEELCQLRGRVQTVAPAECRLFGECGKSHESLGPPGVAKAPARSGYGQAPYNAVRGAMDEGRKFPISACQNAGLVFAVTPEQFIRPHPR